MSNDRDPVAEVLGEDRDLYDVATWENRTVLDAIAVFLTSFLKTASRAAVVLAALAIFVGQLALSILGVIETETLGLLVGLSVLPALILGGYVWRIDPTLREPPVALVITFALGVLLAGFAAVVNSTLEPLFGGLGVAGTILFFYVVVGPGEEFVKWLSVRLYAFRRDDFRAVVDGAVYGAMAGLGFATIENALYISTAVEGGANAIGITSVRGLAGPGHVIYSAFAGYYLGLAKFNRENAGPIVVKGLLIAALIHATYNAAVTVLPFSFLTFVAFVVVYDGVFIAILLRKIGRYRDAYREADAVTPDDPDRMRGDEDADLSAHAVDGDDAVEPATERIDEDELADDDTDP